MFKLATLHYFMLVQDQHKKYRVQDYNDLDDVSNGRSSLGS
jgi:hypothetical protein